VRPGSGAHLLLEVPQEEVALPVGRRDAAVHRADQEQHAEEQPSGVSHGPATRRHHEAVVDEEPEEDREGRGPGRRWAVGGDPADGSEEPGERDEQEQPAKGMPIEVASCATSTDGRRRGARSPRPGSRGMPRTPRRGQALEPQRAGQPRQPEEQSVSPIRWAASGDTRRPVTPITEKRLETPRRGGDEQRQPDPARTRSVERKRLQPAAERRAPATSRGRIEELPEASLAKTSNVFLSGGDSNLVESGSVGFQVITTGSPHLHIHNLIQVHKTL